MSKKLNTYAAIKSIITIALLIFLSGCIGLQPVPRVARAGDVVSITLGGFKRNLEGQVLTPADLTVTLTDANSVVHTPAILGIYRAFPDHISEYAVNTQDRSDMNFGDLYPYDGAVWVSIALVDPSTAAPLPLATGQASMSIASTKLKQTYKMQDGDYSNIPVDIIPGQNGPLSNLDLQFQAYRSFAYLTIRPDVDPTVTIGGVQFEIVYDESLISGFNTDLHAVPITHNPNTSVIQSITDNGTTRTLKVFVTNPNGFVSVANWGQTQGTYDDLVMAIASPYGVVGLVSNALITAPGTIDLVSVNSYYIDINGNPVGSVNPILINEFSGT